MARQRKSKFKTVITWLLLLLLLVGGVGAILHFSGVSKDDITDIVKPVFRIEYSGSVYKVDTENNVIALSESGQSRFEIKGTSSYTAVIVPNVTAETDFDYTVDDKTYRFGDETDLSSAFDLKCYDNAFTISTVNGCSLENVLSRLWNDKTVTVSEHEYFPVYKLVVTSSSGEVIEMVFGPYVTDIELPESIVL